MATFPIQSLRSGGVSFAASRAFSEGPVSEGATVAVGTQPLRPAQLPEDQSATAPSQGNVPGLGEQLDFQA